MRLKRVSWETVGNVTIGKLGGIEIGRYYSGKCERYKTILVELVGGSKFYTKREVNARREIKQNFFGIIRESLTLDYRSMLDET